MDNIKFTKAELKQAEKQGWRVSDYGKNVEVRYRLEKDDERNVFETDSDAWVFVYNARTHGDELASKTFEFLRINAFVEYEKIINHIIEEYL